MSQSIIAQLERWTTLESWRCKAEGNCFVIQDGDGIFIFYAGDVGINAIPKTEERTLTGIVIDAIFSHEWDFDLLSREDETRCGVTIWRRNPKIPFADRVDQPSIVEALLTAYLDALDVHGKKPDWYRIHCGEKG